MPAHIVLWVVCLALIGFLSGTSALTLGFSGNLAVLLLGGILTAVMFDLIAKLGTVKRAKQFRRGDDYFDALWNSLTLALSSIFLALTFDTAIKNAGWDIPYDMLILTPLSTLAIWLVASLWGGNSDKTFKKRIAPGTPKWRTAILLLLFGLATGFGAQVALKTVQHALHHQSSTTQGAPHVRL